MGLFDFLFTKKREEAERLERERIEAAERERRLIEENEAAARRLEAKEVRREARQQTRIQQASSVSSIQAEVDRIIQTYEARNIPQLQQYLFELYSKFNRPGGGRLITSYPQKDRLCEVFLLCLQYDWMNDDDIREVWAENALYCIAEYFKVAESNQDYFAAALNLFLTCAYGKRNLYPKLNDILRKARLHPFHSSVFSEENYQGGARNLVSELQFFSATLLSPVVRAHPHILTGSVREEYERAKSDFQFAGVSPDEIFKKLNLISAIIGSILNDM